MITEDVNAGTACANCKKLGHFCQSVIAMDGIPYCDSCYGDQDCEAIKAHRIRITGLGGVEDCNLSGPTKSLPISRAQRKPIQDVEFKSSWRADFERRSLEDRNTPRLVRAKVPRRPRERKPVAPLQFCACGKRMKGGNKKGRCNACSQKNRYLRVDMRKCGHADCLEKINSRNKVGLCRWHNPNNEYRAKYKNSKPKMMEAA